MRDSAALLLALLATACAPEAAPTPEAEAPPAEGTVVVEGAELPYRIVGRGRPCIVYGSTLLYGNTYSSRLATELRCVHFTGRVFLPDAQRRGGVPHGILEAVADIEAVRTQLGLDSIVVMGNSIVGLVAMAYAAAYPQHTAFAVSVAGPPSVPFASDSAQAYRQREMSPARVAVHEASRAKLDSIQAAHPGRGFIPAYIANGALYWADSTYDATGIFEGVQVNDTLFYDLQRTPFAWAEDAPPVSVPIFVALGRHDYVVAPNVWSGVGTPFTDLTIHVFERAGHWPHFEDPVAFDAALLTWVRAREGAVGR
jgi:proline iminopeptidase